VIVVHIVFPDGTTEDVEVDICDFLKLDDLTETVCKELASRWVPSGRKQQRYIEGCKRWMLGQLLEALTNYAKETGILPGGVG